MALRLFLVFPDEHTLIVGLAGGQQVVDNTGQFVSRGGDGLGRSQSGAQTAIKVAQTGARAGQRLGRDAQDVAGTAVTLPGLGRQDLAAALFVGRAQSQPAGESGHVGKSAEVWADFGRRWAVSALMPGMAVRSTPKIRLSSGPISKANSFLLRLCTLGSG